MNRRQHIDWAVADAVVLAYPFPTGLMRWRATAVLQRPHQQALHHDRITAAGFTPAHAERRCRRAIARHLLDRWR